MILIFWQGIISIHQKNFLEALTKQPSVTKVLMVVENDITPYRKNMGWEVPEIKGVEIIVSPSQEEVKRIFREYKDAVHVTGGVRVGKMMTRAFDECVRVKGKMGVMSEAFDKTGIKGKLRQLKYYYNKLRHYRQLDFFLAIGKEGVKTYTEFGFNPKRVFPWAYFIDVDVPEIKPLPENKEVKRIIYAGRIEEGKGIHRFAEQLAQAPKEKYQLDIYGGGPDEVKLRQLVADNGLEEQIGFYPFLKYNDLIKQYVNYDWVILPSTKKDGWGVIINEGFLNGLKAVCSNICGVSWAVRDNFNGVTFDWSKEGSCRKAIDKMLDDTGFADSSTIKEWANEAVSGEAGARYYMQILECVYGQKEMPKVPWV
jgi:glycosyltransferase involved in cell wall biosynthesis